MKKENQVIVQKSLEAVCRQFIEERRKRRKFPLGEMVYLYIWLQGEGLSRGPEGFVVFLRKTAAQRPTTADLTSANIGAYWEYLAQHFGVLDAANAMCALKQLWVWALQNQHIPYQNMPPDLTGNGVKKPYRVTTQIKVSS